MLFCSSCGADRRAVAPIAPCPACGAAGYAAGGAADAPQKGDDTQSGATARPANNDGEGRKKKRSALDISPPVAIAAIVVAGLLFWVWGAVRSDHAGASEAKDQGWQPYVEPAPPPPPSPRLVIDEFPTLNEGQGLTWKLSPGTYELEITSTPDGAKIEWAGADCARAGETKDFRTTCVLTQTGQLQVTNPTTLGLGSAITVTIRVTSK